MEVTNAGKMYGQEVVQLYTRDMVASISPDIRKLARFTKIGLEPGESEIVSFTLHTKDLAFVGIDNKWLTEPGEFRILIGGTPSNLQTKSFYLK